MYNRAEVQRFAHVRWYWQKQEVTGRLHRLLKGHKMDDNEVILDLTNSFERDIDLETVVGKCQVRAKLVSLFPHHHHCFDHIVLITD